MTDNKLHKIDDMITDYLASGRDMLVSTQRLLNGILDTIRSEEDMPTTEPLQEVIPSIIVSCDASIKTNPGGPAAVGVVIRFPDRSEPVSIARAVPALTNNEAEYDAIYEGLVFLANTVNRPQYPIIVRSDSQLVVNQLKGQFTINQPTLSRRFNSIHELAAALPVPVEIQWHPRNSTPDLTTANFIAQDVLGVRRH
jgi:ribonuclease HI